MMTSPDLIRVWLVALDTIIGGGADEAAASEAMLRAALFSRVRLNATPAIRDALTRDATAIASAVAVDDMIVVLGVSPSHPKK